MNALVKYILVLFVGLCCFKMAQAQQRPQYSQYLFNNFLLNPALSGIEAYGDIRLGYRNQWVGFEGAPKTLFMTGSWSVGKEFKGSQAMGYAVNENYTTQHEYTERYQASENHHGVGFNLVGDQIGPFKNIYASFTYAYHIKLAEQLNLSVGAGVGVVNIGFDRNALNFENENDPAVNNYIPNQIKPDASVGTWLYGSRFFVGASVQNAIPFEIKFTKDLAYQAKAKYVPHLFFTGGYKFFILNNVSFTPSVLVKYVSPAPVNFDVNVKFAYRDRIWLGGGYRRSDSMSAMFGVNISPSMNFTYSYDFTTSAIRNRSAGSHEIMVGFLLNNVYKVICPQKMW